ncbi:hypothetical protein MNV49_006011 [Pseudohyphozyma bogoriensis]|nr:hypothetical protein MNV49_006011 [Pseudohyphozyma bogoriensis]
MYKNPPPGADEAIWFKAVRENPDPEHLVPALALGFSALSKRIESQNKLTASHGALLDEVSKHLSTLSSTHSLQTSLRVMRATQNSQALTGRLLALIAKSSALSPNRNMSVRKEEEALRVGLEKLEVEVKAEGERVNALWAGVGAVKARAEREGKGDRREWGVADEEGLEKVSEILSQQQAGLDHLIKTLVAADRDLDVMKEAFGLPTGSGAAVKPRQ